MKLLLLTAAVLAATIQIARSEEPIHVLETCDKHDCRLTFQGPDSACIRKAKARNWDSGLEAALFVRDCLDSAVSKRTLAGGGQ